MAAETDDGFQLTQADIEAYEADNGRIPRRAMVILRTGFDALFGTPAFLDPAPGFAGDAVQWMVDDRRLGHRFGHVRSGRHLRRGLLGHVHDILNNDRVALPTLDNLDSLAITGIVMAPTVALANGSGYQNDPLACHAGRRTSASPEVATTGRCNLPERHPSDAPRSVDAGAESPVRAGKSADVAGDTRSVTSSRGVAGVDLTDRCSGTVRLQSVLARGDRASPNRDPSFRERLQVRPEQPK